MGNHSVRLSGIIATVLMWLIAGAAGAKEYAGKVAEVTEADTLLLDDQREVKLAGIWLPLPNAPGAALAATWLRGHVQGKAITLSYMTNGKPVADRRGRYVALMRDESGQSVQAMMVEAGVAMVDGAYGMQEKMADWLRLEAVARQKRRGLWAEADYAVLQADNAEQAIGRFAIIEGKVRSVTLLKNIAYINFGDDWKKDFSLTVERRWQKRFPEGYLASLEGKTVQVRGMVYQRGGAMVDVTRPEQIMQQRMDN